MSEEPGAPGGPPRQEAEAARAGRRRELAVRVGSSAVLAAAALTLTWAGQLPFAALVTAGAIAVAWEWGRIVRGSGSDAAALVHMGAVLVAIALTLWGLAGLGVVWLVIVAGVLAVAGAAPGGRMGALGVLYVGLPAVALVWLRGDTYEGWLALLLIFVVVWTTDSFAYIAGRRIGGPRLWPAVSPGKTWSGALGGLLGAALAAGLFAYLVGSGGMGQLVLEGAVLSVVAQAGDLLESALKRRYGVKDASGLIPGHGGMFDRVDGLMLAALVAAVIGTVLGPDHPAAALLGLG